MCSSLLAKDFVKCLVYHFINKAQQNQEADLEGGGQGETGNGTGNFTELKQNIKSMIK